MSPNVYLCIVSSIHIAYCFVHIAIRIVSVFSRIDPALLTNQRSCISLEDYNNELSLIPSKINKQM